jgi:CO/xanthine dehydrogenase FAD-binding subunit
LRHDGGGSDLQRGAAFFGGGTLLMRDLNEGRAAFSAIVRTTDADFRAIRTAGSMLEIGAGATMSDILANRDLAVLHQAARAVGGPAIRNMATVGGNLFAPTPYGDFATALLALDARVAAATGSSGGRETPLADFLRNRDRNAHGVISHVSVPRPPGGDAFRFVKVSRVRPKGISVITIAAHLPLSGGWIQGARVAYGAMAPTPIRVAAVEQALEGKPLDEQGIAKALSVAADGTSPASDPIASQWYRREMAPVYLKRLLLG